MKKTILLLIFTILFGLVGCGEPSQKEVKTQAISILKKDKHIPKEFIQTLKIKYGNGTLLLYNNCPELIKINDKKLSKEYKEKEKKRKDVWEKILAVGMGDTIWDKSLRFREECEQLRYRAAALLETIDGVKNVKVLK